MKSVTKETLLAAIEILGIESLDDDEVDAQISNLVNDPMTVRRLVDWPPEAFGLVLISHGWKINLPTTFTAFDARQRSIEFRFDREPIFAASLLIAQEMYHNGPRDIFKTVSLRSAMLDTVISALNAGASVDGATLSGPALIGIPAEVYQLPKTSFWQRILLYARRLQRPK